MKTLGKKFAVVGILIPVLFWVTLAACGELLGDYSHLRNLVSELGAEGTETRWLFASGLLVCSALSLVFIAGLFLECRKSGLRVLPILLLLSFSFSIAGAAIFPMPHPMHGQFALPFALVLLSPPLAIALWRRGLGMPGLREFSAASILLMGAGTLVFVPSVLGEYFGLKQRFMHAGWSVWFAYLSLAFSGIPGQGNKERVDISGSRFGSGSA